MQVQQINQFLDNLQLHTLASYIEQGLLTGHAMDQIGEELDRVEAASSSYEDTLKTSDFIQAVTDVFELAPLLEDAIAEDSDEAEELIQEVSALERTIQAHAEEFNAAAAAIPSAA